MEERERKENTYRKVETYYRWNTFLFDQWLLTATRRIVVRRERRSTQREFIDHFQLRMEYFLSKGLSQKEAQKRAVEALGDPKEVGQLLTKVHQPILSWCLRLTRIILALLILAAAISWLKKPSYRGAEQDTVTYEYTLAKREGAAEGEWRLGVFDVKLIDARQRMNRFDQYQVEDGTETLQRIDYSYELRLELDFSAAPWYSPDPSALEKYFSIVDDRGKVHRHEYYTKEADMFDEDDLQTRCSFSGNIITMKLREAVEWVDLVYEGEMGKRTMRIAFAPWETVEGDGLLPLDDESAQVQRLTGSDWDPLELPHYEIVSVRKLTAKGEPEDGSICVPWARMLQLRPLEDEPWYHEHYLVEFIAVTRGPLWEMLPILRYTTQIQSINFALTADGAHKHMNVTASKSTLSFVDAFVSRNCFDFDVEAELYKLTYNGPQGPVTITLTPGEEAAP